MEYTGPEDTMRQRRRQRRIPLSGLAKVLKIGSKAAVDAELMDISNYGARFKTTFPFRANDRIMLSIVLDQEGEIVASEEVVASVRWMENSSKEKSAGAQFDIKISDKGFPRFNQRLEYLKTHE